jgi:hypothetical protein
VHYAQEGGVCGLEFVQCMFFVVVCREGSKWCVERVQIKLIFSSGNHKVRTKDVDAVGWAGAPTRAAQMTVSVSRS